MSDVLGPIAAFTFTILIIGYLVQSRLPPPKPKIVGIDLGTTFSCVGVYNAVSGNVTVLIDEQGDRLTPSVVYIGNTDVIIGSGASLQSAKHPENLIYDAKRFIGKEVPSKDYLSRIQNLYPFKIVEDGKDRNGFKFSVSNSGNVSYFEPEDIGAFILRKLKKTAEQKLERKITMAVMSVPAEFDSKQRNATVEAGKRAGLHVLRLINEPTAAALAYGLHKRDGINNVIVVDFGGGTMDVSLLSIQGGMFYTIAMAGNNRLGGQDVNQNLMEYLKLVISKTHGIDLSNQMDLQRLRSEVENIKINLTSFFVVDIHIPFQATFKNGSHFTFSHRINRETFNDINAELFLKVLKPIKRVLDEAKFSTNDVDEIVLVGGSTRIPKVRDIVGDFFGKKPNVEIDPELAVVTGVSIQAGILGGMWPLQVAAVELPTSHIQKIQVGDD
eukprot:gene20635-22670_t